MKQSLEKVSLALAGPGATTPTANMVRIANGKLQAYGGIVCITLPWTGADLDCCFFPRPLIDFYRIPREGDSLTLKDNILTVHSPTVTVKIKTVPSDQMPIIDVIRPPVECGLNLDNLRTALVVWRRFNESATSPYGIEFRDGFVFSGHAHCIFRGSSGLPVNMSFVLPPGAVEVLLKLGAVTQIAADEHVKFWLPNNVTLVARTLTARSYPRTIDDFFDAPDATPVEFLNKDEISAVKTDSWDIHGPSGIMETTVEGADIRLSNSVRPMQWTGSVSGPVLQTLLSLDVATLAIDDGRRIVGTKPGASVIGALNWKPK